MVDKHKTLANILAKQMAVGVIEGNWPFEALHELATRHDVLFWWVVRPDGRIYLADRADFIGTLAYDYFPRLRDRTAGTHTYLDRKKNFGIALEPLKAKGGDWSFWLGHTQEQISDATGKIIVVAAVLCVTVLGALGAILFLIVRHFLKPLAGLLGAAALIGNGNLAHRLPVTTEDELGQLAVAFNSMVENLRRITVFRNQLEQRVEDYSFAIFHEMGRGTSANHLE